MKELTVSMIMEKEITRFTCIKKKICIDKSDVRGSKYLMFLGISLLDLVLHLGSFLRTLEGSCEDFCEGI